MISHKLCVLLLALALSTTCWPEIAYTPAWQVSGRGGFSAANQLKDPESGTTLGIVVCEVDVGVVCIDANGDRLWEYPMVPPVFAAPAVGDVDGDGREEVVAADSAGNLAVLAEDGTLEWRAPGAMGRVCADSCPAIADLDGDGRAEILVGDTAGTLSCIENGGALRWQFTGDGTQMGPVLVADLYDIPGQEIIVTSHDGHIYTLSAAGEWLWDIYRADDLFPNSTPVLADVDGDGTPELYVGGGLHHFYRIDLRTANVALEENVYLHVNSAIAATDIDGDGADEVLFGNKGGQTWCYGMDGFKWTHELRKSSLYAAPIIVDLDGDPELEIIFHSSQMDLHVFESDGSMSFSAMTLVKCPVTPLAGDLDGDGMLDLVSTSLTGGLQGDGTLVYARMGTPWREDRRNRTVFAGDRTHAGRRPDAAAHATLPVPSKSTGKGQARITPLGDLTLLSGRNTWRFDIDNPANKRLVLIATINFPDGTMQHFAKHVRGAKERAVLSFTVREPGVYKAGFRLLDADKRELLDSKDESFRYAGFQSDYAYLNEVVFAETGEVVHQWQATNPRAAAHFGRQLTGLKSLLAGLDSAPDDAGVERLAELRQEAERLRALALAGAALAPTGSFFAWEFCPWAYFDARDCLPSPEEKTGQFSASLLIGECESLALNLTNLSARTLEVRVSCGGQVALRRAVTVPTIRREEVADALPRLDQGRLLTIPPLESQQLWITLNADALAPGDYVAPVTLTSVEPEPTEVTVPIAITVYDLALPRPSPLRFCVWSHEGGVLGTDNDDVLTDLIDHGVNVFFGRAPSATCDAEGNLTGPVDFEAHDESVARYSPHGLMMFASAQHSVKGATFLSAPWRKAYRTYLREWARHMKELDLDYADWALYPYDEPSTPFTETTLNLVEVAKATREADPNIMIYTDPTSGTTMKSIEMLTGLIDIWCPSAELLERLADEMVPVIKDVGKEVWFYDAAGRAKTLSTLGLYRWRFWYAWNLGFTGVGWWTYAHGDEQWKGWNSFGDYFCTVYPGADGVVTSKRWEAAREGIEDYELLYLLRKAIRTAEAQGVSGPVLAEARSLLAQVPKEMESTLYNAGRRIPLTPDSVPMYEQITAALQDARQRVIDACLVLRAKARDAR